VDSLWVLNRANVQKNQVNVEKLKLARQVPNWMTRVQNATAILIAHLISISLQNARKGKGGTSRLVIVKMIHAIRKVNLLESVKVEKIGLIQTLVSVSAT